MHPLWWRLPGPSRFVEQVAEQLREANNLILGLPTYLPDGLEATVRARVESSGFGEWVALSVTEAPPAHLLFERFVPDAPKGELRNAYTLSRQEEFGGRVIWLRGLTLAVWPRWCEFLLEYAQACRAVEHFHRSIFCAPLCGEAALETPGEDVCLGVLRWSGVVDPLDMQVYAAELLRSRRMPSLHKSLHTAVLAALALWDPSVCHALADQPLSIVVQPEKLLAELAAERHWPVSNATGARAWALGLSDRINGQEQYHSAALQVIGDAREITRRIWSAEVSVLLPFVEEQRQQIIAHLDGALRGPFRTSDGRETSDPHDLEIGEIVFHLTARGRTVPPEARTLRDIRNRLAHREVLSTELLESNLLRDGRPGIFEP